MKPITNFSWSLGLALVLGLYLSCSGSDQDPEDLIPVTHTGDLFLRTTADLMQFQADNITDVTGRLYIGSNVANQPSDISDLSYLAKLQSVGGELQIQNTQLRSLEGLEGLMSAGEVYIRDNDLLESMEHLTQLETDVFQLSQLPLLNSLNGLDALKPAMKELGIFTCPQLNDLSGLENITSVDYLSLVNNTRLSSLNGLQNLVMVGQEFRFEGDNGLQNFEGLSSLRGIGVSFRIRESPLLQNFRGLEKLEALQLLEVDRNHQLANLTGLEGLTNLVGIEISDNDALLSLEGLSNLTELISAVIEENDRLQDLSHLGGLTLISSLTFENNDGLSSTQGLNLEGVNGLAISGNAELTDLSGFSKLTAVGRLSIRNNAKLNNLNGLENIGRINELNIVQNALLEDISALGNARVLNVLSLVDNPNLTFNSLPVKSPEALLTLALIGSPKITSLQGLETLTMTNLLNVSNMDGLVNLDGLSGLTRLENLLINDNDNLESIEGLANVNSSGMPVEFRRNPKLADFCALTSLVNSADFGGNFFTENNAYNPDLAAMQAGNCKED